MSGWSWSASGGGSPASEHVSQGGWFGRGAFRAINVPGDFRASTNIGAMQTKALPISTPPTLNAKSCKEA
jgi:hypothetical protein